MTIYPLPPIAQTIGDTRISHRLVLDLLLKLMYVNGLQTATALVGSSRLSLQVVADMVEEMRDQQLIESLGSRPSAALQTANAAGEMRYALTSKGINWATEALKQSGYVGPAPVSLNDFKAQIARQRLTSERVNREALDQSFKDLVLPEAVLAQLGPAANSGRSILLYGRAGNGKTCIAEALGDCFEDLIVVPYCIEVDGQIINFYDEHVHKMVETEADRAADTASLTTLSGAVDRRWLHIRRPTAIVGGELTLEMLDLLYNPTARFYEAPAHLKSMNGIFVIDDFGRQRTSPESILNRAIIPLERGIDYLSLHTGKKFPIPFDVLVVFSSNMHPADLGDEAMLRRIYYKIEIPLPTAQDYALIWQQLAAQRGFALPASTVPFLEDRYYRNPAIDRAGFHPKYFTDQVKALCDFQGREFELAPDLLELAAKNLFAGQAGAIG